MATLADRRWPREQDRRDPLRPWRPEGDTLRPMEIGICSFGEVDPAGPVGAGERLRNLIEEVELADQVGLDVFALGEHHRPDFAVSAPAVVLAAVAERTRRIRLSSAVSVLSSDDPVRVFQQFSTLDLLSQGRAEIMAGRGSFIESFPLFGYNLEDYEALYEEKLDLLLAIRETEHVTWSGSLRAPIDGRGIYPRPEQNPLPVWIAVGGTPRSAARAGSLGLPMALAIIGGMPERFAPFAEIHRREAAQAGIPAPKLGINSHGFIADTSQEAIADSFGPVSTAMYRIGKERGWSLMTRGEYEASAGLRGANFVGSPEQIVEKILFQHEIFGHDRFLLQLTVGAMPHAKTMRAIELLGTEVAPAVRHALAVTQPA